MMMMNLLEKESVCSDIHREDHEEEFEEEVMIMNKSKVPLHESPSSKFRDFLKFESHQQKFCEIQQQSSLNFDNKFELIDLSLSSSNYNNKERNETSSGNCGSIRIEHMFDKVVTPSDVGKLNRLVIPKQHAEKYFPLDTSSNEKGLILNFEDRNGKQWRFRYSYWNSSQSYVMTKGWSRFVKEKKLDAGDIVSFQREIGGDLGQQQQRFYIDWRRRPSPPASFDYNSSFIQFEFQRYNHNLKWTPQLHSIQQHPYGYGGYNYNHNQGTSFGNCNCSQYNYLRPHGNLQIGPSQSQDDHHNLPMVINSLPVVHGRSVGKRLRLFGVNMECFPTQDNQIQQPFSATTLPYPHNLASTTSATAPLPATSILPSMVCSKKLNNSLSIDLDL